MTRPARRRARAGVGAAVLAATALGLWWVRAHPGPLPYAARIVVQVPHPLLTRRRLRRALEPRPGERVLEVGPGTGYYSVPTARWLQPNGRLDVLDVDQGFLDHTVRAAERQGLLNVVPTRGDARRLPYDDATFDAVCLVATLGEIPDQTAALREVARVLKPSGRLVVGEYVVDVDWVAPRALTRRAEASGLRLVRRCGPRPGCFSLLRRADSAGAPGPT